MKQIDGLNVKNVINGERQKRYWERINILCAKKLIRSVMKNKRFPKAT